MFNVKILQNLIKCALLLEFETSKTTDVDILSERISEYLCNQTTLLQSEKKLEEVMEKLKQQ